MIVVSAGALVKSGSDTFVYVVKDGVAATTRRGSGYGGRGPGRNKGRPGGGRSDRGGRSQQGEAGIADLSASADRQGKATRVEQMREDNVDGSRPGRAPGHHQEFRTSRRYTAWMGWKWPPSKGSA